MKAWGLGFRGFGVSGLGSSKYSSPGLVAVWGILSEPPLEEDLLDRSSQGSVWDHTI